MEEENVQKTESFGNWIQGILLLTEAAIQITDGHIAENEENGPSLYPLREVLEVITDRINSDEREYFESRI